MEGFVVFKYLHIVSMFFAVALAVSTEVVLRRVATSGDAQAIRTVVGRLRPLGNVATGFFVGGVFFGIIAALTGQIDLLAPWLILAYAAFIGATLIGFLITDPWTVRLEAAATATVEGGSANGLRAVVDDPVPLAGTWALMALVALLVFLMVVKPLA